MADCATRGLDMMKDDKRRKKKRKKIDRRNPKPNDVIRIKIGKVD